MKIKAIFYDFDGVIKESTQIKTEAFYELYLPYGEAIALKAKQHHIEHGGISRFEKFKLYHKTFLNIDLSEDEIQTFAKSFSNIVLDKVISCDFVPGALETLNSLKDKYHQYIVTGTPQNEIEIILDKMGIRELFKGVYGSPENKISISGKIINANSYLNDEVVFVGDASTDYKAASHFNFHFILREHDENISLFENVQLIKSKDLSNLEALINNL